MPSNPDEPDYVALLYNSLSSLPNLGVLRLRVSAVVTARYT
jgi:hypothetical protein